MRYYFFLFFLAVVTADVFAVIYATDQTHQTTDNGISFTRESTSSPSYDYLIFTNNNKYDVMVTYIIDKNMPTKILLKAGESKKTTSAYKNSLKVETIVEPSYKKIEFNNKAPKEKATKQSNLEI